MSEVRTADDETVLDHRGVVDGGGFGGLIAAPIAADFLRPVQKQG